MSAGVGIKILRRKDTGAYQIISVVAGGPAKASGMVQDNDTLVKVRPAAVHLSLSPALSVSVSGAVSGSLSLLCPSVCVCAPVFW